MPLRSHKTNVTIREASDLWSRRCLSGGLFAAACLSGSIMAFAQPQASAQEGAKLFQQICVACHTIGGGRLVGPDLKGVTERRSAEWLARFIADPERMRRDDPIAMANFKEFGVPMPRLGLTEAQVAAIIAYFASAQAAPAGMPAPYLPTLLASLVAVAALTLVGLVSGRKKVDGGTA